MKFLDGLSEKQTRRQNKRLKTENAELRRENTELKEELFRFYERVKIMDEKEEKYDKLIMAAESQRDELRKLIELTKKTKKNIEKNYKQFDKNL